MFYVCLVAYISVVLCSLLSASSSCRFVFIKKLLNRWIILYLQWICALVLYTRCQCYFGLLCATLCYFGSDLNAVVLVFGHRVREGGRGGNGEGRSKHSIIISVCLTLCRLTFFLACFVLTQQGFVTPSPQLRPPSDRQSDTRSYSVL